MTEIDNRRHPRVDAHLVVRSRQLDPSELPILASSLGRPDPPIPQLNVVRSGARITQLTSVNLSLGGLSTGGDLEIDSERTYAKGSDVVVEFELNDGQPPVRAVAQVMWNTNAEGRHLMGLMFLLISDSAFMRIQDFVQKNMVP
jgi:hypothetical protein